MEEKAKITGPDPAGTGKFSVPVEAKPKPKRKVRGKRGRRKKEEKEIAKKELPDKYF